jgi:hypothetical protein
MKLYPFTLMLIILALSACESLVTEVGPESLPDTESKLVVQSFISPQASRIIVVVTESMPLFGESNGTLNIVKNAIVKISDGNREATMRYDSTGSSYSIERTRFNIVAGKTYQLSVTDGERSIQSTCTVPLKTVNIKSYVIDTVFSENSVNPDTTITVKMTWDDIPGEANFYRLRSSLELEYSVLDGDDPENYKERRVRNRFNVDWDRSIGRNDYQSDVNLDGTVFSSPIGRFRLPAPMSYQDEEGSLQMVYPKAKIVSLTLEVDNTEENYFKYHRSLQLRNTDNPFSEPALIFSNITNGLGCFAAYNSGFVTFKPAR